MPGENPDAVKTRAALSLTIVRLPGRVGVPEAEKNPASPGRERVVFQ